MTDSSMVRGICSVTRWRGFDTGVMRRTNPMLWREIGGCCYS